MKKTLLLVAIFLMASIATANAARVRIPVGERQKITQVKELPDSAYYQTKAGDFINLGYMYTVYQVAYIPVWTTDKGKLVGYVPSEPDTYYDLDEDMLSWIAEDTGIENLDKLKSMPFWDAWGGKLIILLLIGGIIFYYASKSDDDDEEEEQASADSAKEE